MASDAELLDTFKPQTASESPVPAFVRDNLAIEDVGLPNDRDNFEVDAIDAYKRFAKERKDKGRRSRVDRDTGTVPIPQRYFIDEARRTVSEMHSCNTKDRAAIESKGPTPLHRFKYLPVIKEQLRKHRKDFKECLIEAGFLEACRAWLRAYKDYSMPGVDLQTSDELVNVDCLEQLPTPNFRAVIESEIGKSLRLIYALPEQVPRIKQKVDVVLTRWVRGYIQADSDSDSCRVPVASELVKKRNLPNEIDLLVDVDESQDKTGKSAPTMAFYSFKVAPPHAVADAEWSKSVQRSKMKDHNAGVQFKFTSLSKKMNAVKTPSAHKHKGRKSGPGK
ncbi:hypothetical protein ACOME3_003818 [Neoechinorhynchus agilis]